MVSKRFEGKVALVTGAGSGIGRASALAFLREGAKIAICDISVEAGTAVAAEIREIGGDVHFERCDVRLESEVKSFVDSTVHAFGRLDFAHNNAGMSWGRGAAHTTEQEWDDTVDLCMKGPWLGMKYQLGPMVASGGGVIVNTSSMSSSVYTPAAGIAYCAAKAGLNHMTRYVAMEYVGRGIRANTISPGLVRTPTIERLYSPAEQDELAGGSQPIKRIMDPSEIAASVIFLCSDDAAMITGADFPVCGGMNAL